MIITIHLISAIFGPKVWMTEVVFNFCQLHFLHFFENFSTTLINIATNNTSKIRTLHTLCLCLGFYSRFKTFRLGIALRYFISAQNKRQLNDRDKSKWDVISQLRISVATFIQRLCTFIHCASFAFRTACTFVKKENY